MSAQELNKLNKLDKLYTIKEATERISTEIGREFKERKLMYLIRTERVQAQKVGWIWVIPEAEVERLVAQYKA